MKRSITLVTIVAAMVMAVTAVQAGTVNWGAQAIGVALADNVTLVAEGNLVQLGYFTLSDATIATASKATLTSDFVLMQSGLFGDGGSGGGASAGNWADGLTTTFTSGAGGAAAGKNIYFWLVNAPTVAGASQLLIAKFTATYPTDTPVPGSAGAELGSGNTLLRGTVGSGNLSNDDFGPEAHDNMVLFVAVPEPSSIVLVGLGLLGMVGLIRRRS